MLLAQQYKHAEQTQLSIGYDARLTSPGYANIIQKSIRTTRFERDQYRLLFIANDVPLPVILVGTVLWSLQAIIPNRIMALNGF